MRKQLLMVALVAFTFSFIACGGKSTTDSSTDNTTTKTETPAPAAKDNDVLAKYENIINKMIKLYEDGKMQSGDASAMQEYTKLAQEMSDISEQLQKEIQNLTPAQVQKISELGQKLTDAATKGMNQ